MPGADLADLTIQGRSASQPLPLARANFAGICLINSHFAYVDLSYADLSRAQANYAEFHHVQARGLNVAEANLRGALWRQSEALDLQGGATAQWYECQWVASLLDPATLPHDCARRGTLTHPTAQPLPAGHGKELTMAFGHTDWV